MKTIRLFGLAIVSAALFAMPAAAQTPDGITPAKEGICDGLADATPGLQGLCVAMCEAQDCEAEYDPDTGEIIYDPSCSPSSKQLLTNYNKIRDRDPNDGDPAMPCVKAACPCWSEQELDQVGGFKIPGNDYQFDKCSVTESAAMIRGRDASGRGGDFAYAVPDYKYGLTCTRIEANPWEYKFRQINQAEFDSCYQSVVDECSSRGID